MSESSLSLFFSVFKTIFSLCMSIILNLGQPGQQVPRFADLISICCGDVPSWCTVTFLPLLYITKIYSNISVLNWSMTDFSGIVIDQTMLTSLPYFHWKPGESRMRCPSCGVVMQSSALWPVYTKKRLFPRHHLSPWITPSLISDSFFRP